MKVDVKKKYSARFEADGTEKAPGEFEPLSELEEKFCARVSLHEILSKLCSGRKLISCKMADDITSGRRHQWQGRLHEDPGRRRLHFSCRV